MEKVEVAKSVPAVQALRLKYQEQRLAKQKPSSVTTLAKKGTVIESCWDIESYLVISVKGKNMIRTRSTVVKDDSVVPTKQVKPVLGLRSGLKRTVNAIKMKKLKAAATKLQRAGLRSGGKIEEPKKVAKDSITSKVKKLTQVIEKPGRSFKQLLKGNLCLLVN